MSKILESTLTRNISWRESILNKNPDYFQNLTKGQSPDILWLGCSDSRTGPEIITQSNLGGFFVQRNVGNLISSHDLSLNSVIDYAINSLHVKDIVLCGHTHCGAIESCFHDESQLSSHLSDWLSSVRVTKDKYRNILNKLDLKDQKEKMVYLNLIEQMINLSHLSIVSKALKEKRVEIHGCIYDMGKGTIVRMVDFNHESDIHESLDNFIRDHILATVNI
ncbi:MAG: carbonic anhydrase [Psittacicella sp.]